MSVVIEYSSSNTVFACKLFQSYPFITDITLLTVLIIVCVSLHFKDPFIVVVIHILSMLFFRIHSLFHAEITMSQMD